MNKEIERGNNINLTNLLARLGNVFPIEHEQADGVTLPFTRPSLPLVRTLPRGMHSAGLSRRTNLSKRTATSQARTSTSTTPSKEKPRYGKGCSVP